MNVGVILARAGSTRLKNKLFLPLGEVNILEYFINRCAQINSIDQLVLATTTTQYDDQIEEIGHQLKIPVYRGSVDDVVTRIKKAALSVSQNVTTITRLNSDNPLFFPHLVDDAIRELVESQADLITPFELNTLPFGSSMVVYSNACLNKIDSEAKHKVYREHVENYCFENANNFNIAYQKSNSNSFLPWANLSLDLKQDYQRIVKLHQHIPNLNHIDQLKKYLANQKVLIVVEDTESKEELNKLKKLSFHNISTSTDLNEVQNQYDLVLSSVSDTPRNQKMHGIIEIEDHQNEYHLRYQSNSMLDAHDEVIYRRPNNISILDLILELLPFGITQLLLSPMRPAFSNEWSTPSDKKGEEKRLGFINSSQWVLPYQVINPSNSNKETADNSPFDTLYINCDGKYQLSPSSTYELGSTAEKTIREVWSSFELFNQRLTSL